MNPLRWLVGRLEDGRRRMLAGLALLDERLADYGPLDDDLALADAVQDSPCDDPWPHFRDTGCSYCRESIIAARALTLPPWMVDAHFANWKIQLGTETTP